MDKETKTKVLQEMFPDMNTYTISHTLSKSNGDWDRTMEELLNHTFFSNQDSHFSDGETKPSHRSVDAFSDSSNTSKKYKKKERRKGRSLEIERPTQSSTDNSTAPPKKSAWQTSTDDIAFLSSRLNLSTTTITSLYHQHSGTLQGTLFALLDSPALAATAPLPADDPIVQIHAAELTHDFPSIGTSDASTLIRLTHPSTSSAHELARALTAQ